MGLATAVAASMWDKASQGNVCRKNLMLKPREKIYFEMSEGWNGGFGCSGYFCKVIMKTLADPEPFLNEQWTPSGIFKDKLISTFRRWNF